MENYQNYISAIVARGEKVATIVYDYPTANLDVNHDIPFVVYSADSNYVKCVCFVPSKNSLECHIKNFNKDIYSEKMELKNITENSDNLSNVSKDCCEKTSKIL